ncbi:hypothetical protein B0T24DRAFT_690259 [Lasiosphaeria ovina]|uniref:Galactose oxidase n=1 Tax=Lasiosphaeria ovina TaxID=92902 RepID=A0AAE0MZ83_9PEZI|nr:hypothetical protein B0T24DRAFT_690259 [Lasiosphaeria ovina]
MNTRAGCLFIALTIAARAILAQTWSDLARLPGTRQEHTTLVLGPTELATIGGELGPNMTTSQVLLYSFTSDSWSQGPPLPVPLNHANAVAHGGKAYVFGGLLGIRFWPPSNDAWVFDPRSTYGTWKTLAQLPAAAQPRGAAAMAVHNGTIYTFGGEGNTAPDSQGVFNNTEVYDTVTNSWRVLPPMRLPRHGTSAVGLRGEVYIPGGALVQGEGGTDVFDAFTPGS